jgi:hypothetical protein
VIVVVADTGPLVSLDAVGMLLQARRDGHVDAIRPIIAAMRGAGVHLADPLVAHVLEMADEA